ncbi:lipoprotein [Streptomyces palmae]|nr:lipoprotein [Streptomyces palmae]
MSAAVAAVAAMVAGAALTGCSSGGSGSGHGKSSGHAKDKDVEFSGTYVPGTDGKGLDKVTPGARPTSPSSGRLVGAAGSPCRLPVTFALAAQWKAKAVKPVDADDPLAELSTQGETRLACEIDAKPAGHIGFLRVWTAPATAGGGDARKVLKGWLAAPVVGDVRKPTYRDITVGGKAGLPAVEVVYESYSKLLDETKQEHAVALKTSRGITVLHLGGLDGEEHEGMLPAYELAKNTMAS